ncbi:MAG: hypothetical protein GFH27_549291n170 [Chloroflexi bacterium AL-W]|nr:hypothetical protein [Chloroflexi bacterium AL-W]
MECARTFKDTFLVLGPPGTGKTKVITELVKNFKAQNLKVLVTSKNNKAVDNVLERLAHQPGMQAIRIGQESKVDEPVKPFLLDVQARALQDQIRARTEGQYQRLLNAAQMWEQTTPELMGLQIDLHRYTEMQQECMHTYKTVQERQHHLWNSRQPQLDTIAKKMHDAHAILTKHVVRYNRSTQTLAMITGLCRIPVVGHVFNPLQQWQLQRAQHRYNHTLTGHTTFDATVTAYYAQIAQIQTDVYGSDWILEAKQQCQQHEKNASHLLTAMHSRITRIHGALPSIIPLPHIPNREIDQIRGYIEHIGVIRELSGTRIQLLEDWRTALQERRRGLYLTLLRSADVIGATCIGIAIGAHISKIDFDVVIADEAGQIQVFDLLVPLVRGQRAILVGDHKQLPPVIEPEMLEYLENEEDEEIRNLGKKSIFELLFVQAHDTHRAMLNIQHRMPASIANFISQEFYENEYFSPDSLQNDPPDPFFQRAFCFIDTLHRRSYRDTRVQDEEEENATGFFNVQEARVLARLAEAYFKQHYRVRAENSTDKTIGIIVPYKRQVKQVANELRQRQLPDDIVATVDAFQGNERDVILFGFTRSNKYGGIGFLDELRRLNVTLTRAKSHIILIGDRHTLCTAKDEAFRACANNLMTYIEQYGQMLTIDDIDGLLETEKSKQYGSFT